MSFGSVGAVLFAARWCAHHFGWGVVVLYYFAPLVVFATFLVITTFLHHNDEEVVWYRDQQWSYVKGNLSSVDRDYGALVNEVSHNIQIHQIHHLFPRIPHYKLRKATEQFKKAYPHLHRVNLDPILPALWRGLVNWIQYGAQSVGKDTFAYKDYTSKEKSH